MFDWLKAECRAHRKKVRLDRIHLEPRARKFLKRYLEAEEIRKPQFYRAVDDISKKCHPAALGPTDADLDDSQIAESVSQAALQMVLDREGRSEKNDQVSEFVTDACATVAIAYRRAAGVYVADKEMQKLGTAAVHLLTLATAYMMRNEIAHQ